MRDPQAGEPSANPSAKPSAAQVALLAIRPKTLPASLSPVVLGTALVPADQINWLLAICALGCALFLQILVNLANDYFDARTGVDTAERLGPVRVTQSQLASPRAVAVGMVVSALLAIGCGLVIVAHSDLLLLGVGLLCVLAALGYSGGPFPLASHGLGELAVLIFFGWVAVCGSFYIHTQSVPVFVFGFANALGVILSAIMLINNIRDIPTDEVAGKRTLAVRLGPVNSRRFFALLMLAVAVFHCLSSALSHNSHTLMLIVLPLAASSPLAGLLIRQLLVTEGRALNNLLARTAMLGLVYSLATSVSWILLS